MSSIEQLRREINPDYAASRGSEKLTGQLTDESESDHRHGLTKTHVCLSHTVHCDAADGGEGATLEVHLARKTDAEV